jgi:hypothetical protein
VPGVAVGLAVGVAVGMGDAEGTGLAPGAGCEVFCEFKLALTVGEGAGRMPAGIPGAAGRNPFELASVEPVLSGAGPEVAGVCAGTAL